MFRNKSLRQAVLTAQQHVNSESRETAALIDGLEAEGWTLAAYQQHVRGEVDSRG